MISRARRILFAFLLISVVTMSAILIRMRERAQDRLHIVHDSAPLIETVETAPQSIALVIPNDLDGSLLTVQRSQSLPPDDSTKARVLLETLIEAFHDRRSTHPIAANPDTEDNAAESTPGANAYVNNVFLMPVPHSAAPSKSTANPGTLAVVDLSAAFAASHPSGIEPETLTLLAMLGTLHANIPSITQVRFLIDGHQAETLAGHADLTRTYLTTDLSTGTPQQ
jgi:hypothetical protein